MKNPFIEKKRQHAKQYAQNWQRQLNSQGNYFQHIYLKTERKQFDCWNDVSFKLGSQIVAVWWEHPRLHYQNLCENLVDTQLEEPKHPINMFSEEVYMKFYMPVGKSRKKVKHSGCLKIPGDNPYEAEWEQYFKQYEILLNQALNQSDFVVYPSIKVEQLNRCRGVNLCLPIEVVDEQSANEMAKIAKSLLLRETTLAELFPDYAYTKENWQQENPR